MSIKSEKDKWVRSRDCICKNIKGERERERDFRREREKYKKKRGRKGSKIPRYRNWVRAQGLLGKGMTACAPSCTKRLHYCQSFVWRKSASSWFVQSKPEEWARSHFLLTFCTHFSIFCMFSTLQSWDLEHFFTSRPVQFMKIYF